MGQRKRGLVELAGGDVGGTYELVDLDSGKSLLFQADWDFPGLATSFGFVPCKCGRTDGSVDCPHKTASQMIAEAQDFLDEHIGDQIPDPGYFDQDYEHNPPMTRGHFELIANVLRVNYPRDGRAAERELWQRIAEDFSAELARTSPNFNLGKFWRAVNR